MSMLILSARLFYEFFKVGLFAVGGGLATIPFLESMGQATGWFDHAQLTTMIAVSESTPGPVGVNMATYVGTHLLGVPGAVMTIWSANFANPMAFLIPFTDCASASHFRHSFVYASSGFARSILSQ